jgi:hypothetical protein
MNIPDYLRVIRTKVISKSNARDFRDSLENLELQGTVIVDWAIRTPPGFPFVATVYICEPKEETI